MKLPQLQNLIKRDPSAYKEEFKQQFRSYQAEFKVNTCYCAAGRSQTGREAVKLGRV